MMQLAAPRKPLETLETDEAREVKRQEVRKHDT
jgi:hypothetical protein